MPSPTAPASPFTVTVTTVAPSVSLTQAVRKGGARFTLRVIMLEGSVRAGQVGVSA